MDHTVTEKDYPIRIRWIVKVSIAPVLLIILLLILLGVSLNGEQSNGIFVWYFAIIFVLIAGQVVVNALKRSCFHYSLEDSFIVVRQGVLATQERRIPYGRIQDILVRRDFSDRIFGLASLMIENATQGSLAISPSYILGKRRVAGEIFGSVGHAVNISGLDKNDAELLQEAISRKTKENPMESISGL